jgi:hypothetical protein
MRIACSVGALLFVLQSALPADDRPAKTPVPTGKWAVAKVRFDGRDCKIEDVSGLNDVVIFKDGVVEGLFCGDKSGISEIDFSPGDPPRFRRRFFGEKKLVITHGVYKLEGDTLQLCETYFSNPQPADFKTTKGDERTVLVLKRVKDA